jgi:hypothetical protein
VTELLSVVETRALAEREAVIERGLATFVDVGTALAEIRDDRLYRAEHGTFEDYCRERWGFSDSRARQMIAAAQTVTNVTVAGLPAPANEGQARELARVPADRRAEVWRETVERTDGKPTAAAIRETANPTPEREPGRLCDVPGHGYGPHRSCPETMPADPLPPEIAEQIEQRIAEKITPEPIQPADPAVRERLALEREEQQSRERYSRSIANCVWLLGEYALRVDAPNWTVDRWQPSQDIYPKKTTAERLRAAGDFLHALAEVWPK